MPFKLFSGLLMAALIFFAIIPRAASGGNMLQAGTPAPDFSATTMDGAPVTLSRLRASGPVVVVFARGFG